MQAKKAELHAAVTLFGRERACKVAGKGRLCTQHTMFVNKRDQQGDEKVERGGDRRDQGRQVVLRACTIAFSVFIQAFRPACASYSTLEGGRPSLCLRSNSSNKTYRASLSLGRGEVGSTTVWAPDGSAAPVDCLQRL